MTLCKAVWQIDLLRCFYVLFRLITGDAAVELVGELTGPDV